MEAEAEAEAEAEVEAKVQWKRVIPHITTLQWGRGKGVPPHRDVAVDPGCRQTPCCSDDVDPLKWIDVAVESSFPP
jgi:hypothetical protein